VTTAAEDIFKGNGTASGSIRGNWDVIQREARITIVYRLFRKQPTKAVRWDNLKFYVLWVMNPLALPLCACVILVALFKS
jgi:hypothetical protein